MTDPLGPKVVGLNIAKFLYEENISARTLAEWIGAHENTVYRWCSGVHFPSIPYLYKVAAVLHKPIEAFFKSEEDPHEQRN